MSISHAAVVGVGLPYYDLLEEGQDWDEIYDWEIISMIQPWYDAGRNDSYLAVVAFEVEDGTIETDTHAASQYIYRAYAQFKKVTGKEGKLILSTNSW